MFHEIVEGFIQDYNTCEIIRDLTKNEVIDLINEVKE